MTFSTYSIINVILNQAVTPYILGFVAKSGTGKTTLISRLIPILNERGYKVGLIKHSHHDFETDQPGKDSYRLRKAGASPVVLVSKHRRAVITELSSGEPTLDEQLHCFLGTEVDLILVEGFKHENFPKIELHRAELAHRLMHLRDKAIIAIVSNTKVDTHLPCLDINKPEQVVDYITHEFMKND